MVKGELFSFSIREFFNLFNSSLLFARNNAVLFLELAKDENINIRNLGIKATETGIIKLSDDQRTFDFIEDKFSLISGKSIKEPVIIFPKIEYKK